MYKSNCAKIMVECTVDDTWREYKRCKYRIPDSTSDDLCDCLYYLNDDPSKPMCMSDIAVGEIMSNCLADYEYSKTDEGIKKAKKNLRVRKKKVG